MDQNTLKQEAAKAALKYVVEGAVIGVGSGSTVNAFIDELGKIRDRIKGAVAASKSSEERLRQAGIDVLDLGEVSDLPVYIDGADEVTPHLHMIKGGGAALTREKVIASVAKTFVCIADGSKLVQRLGKFPLPIEVVPFARSVVARQLVKFGGQPEWRMGVVTDNGNVLLDVHNLDILDPPELERQLNQIPGIVTNGVFALRGADVLLLARPTGIETITRG